MKKVMVFVSMSVVVLVSLAVGQPIVTPEVVIEAATEASKWLQPDNLYYLFQILVVIIGVAAPFLLKGWGGLIKIAKDKSQNELIDQILSRIQIVMPAVVKSVYEAYIKTIRKAGEDKELSREEITTANSIALDKVKRILGPSAIGILTKNGVDLEQYIAGLTGVNVEQAKRMFKKPTGEDSKN